MASDSDVFKEIPLTPGNEDIAEVEIKAGRSHFIFCKPKPPVTTQPNRDELNNDLSKQQVKNVNVKKFYFSFSNQYFNCCHFRIPWPLKRKN